MAPELALDICRSLPKGASILDPMAGSGTTIRAAIDSGHDAVGVDMDPMAVLLARTWTTPVSTGTFRARARDVVNAVAELSGREACLAWIDEDSETREFTERWFGPTQRETLRRFAKVLYGRRGATWDLCRVALSRTIITKDRGASLARDVSHSRPHLSYKTSDYDVIAGFGKAVEVIARRMDASPVKRRARVHLGDARELPFPDASFDAVVTSPPYLNAIDYLRGHKLSLVWFGHPASKIREIRGAEVGSERGLASASSSAEDVLQAMGAVDELPARTRNICRRYAVDVSDFVSSTSRVLRPGALAVYVVGNSTVRGQFLSNDAAVAEAATQQKMVLVSRTERELPPSRRYLPPPSNAQGKLDGRMRSEVVLTFRREAS
jgi:SAM-dependent methyltransferase